MSIEKSDSANHDTLRNKAEKLLKSKQKKAIKPNTETDIKKLLHELQVHQIELEMQNEELRKANETVEVALKKYTMLYDCAPMGFLTLDSEGRICDLNFTAAELLDDKRYSLMNSNFKLFIAKEYQNAFSDFLNRVFVSSTKESCNVKLGYNGMPLSFVYMEGIVTGDDYKCLLSVVEISKIKQQNNS